jgi:Na+-exporting ATPase
MGNKGKEPDTQHVSGQANEPLSGLPHTLTVEQILSEIGGNCENGLTAAEAATRLEKYGKNELDDSPGASPVKIFVRQVANAMTLVKRTICPGDRSQIF